MATALAETTNISVAEQAERDAPPGLLEVRFYTTEPIGDADLQVMFDHLSQSGVDVRKVYQSKTKGLYYVGVIYNKPAPTESISALPLAVIPLIAFGFIAVLIGIGIFKIGDITTSVAKILLILFGGTIVIVALTRKPLEAVATRYMRK